MQQVSSDEILSLSVPPSSSILPFVTAFVVLSFPIMHKVKPERGLPGTAKGLKKKK